MTVELGKKSGCSHVTFPADYEKIMAGHSSMFLWTSPWYYFPARMLIQNRMYSILRKFGGPLKDFDTETGSTVPVAPAAGAVKA